MATLASTPIVIPFDPASQSLDRRREYLCSLWRADVDLFVLIGTARRLGYALDYHWDSHAGMPVVNPTVLH
jgi:hypothetical protein